MIWLDLGNEICRLQCIEGIALEHGIYNKHHIYIYLNGGRVIELNYEAKEEAIKKFECLKSQINTSTVFFGKTTC